MCFVKSRPCLLLMGSLLLLIPACTQTSGPPSEESEQQGQLQEIWYLYRGSPKFQVRIPKSTADIKEGSESFLNGYRAIQSGTCVVFWGVELDKASPDAILAYEKDVPDQGGFVLQADGTVKRMTAEEFRAAPKAQK